MHSGPPPSEASRPLRLTVFGANGGTGHALVRQALTAGHDVTAVTRHPEQFQHHHPRLVIQRGDATNPADVRSAVADADVVLSALGVPYSRAPITLYSRSAGMIVAAMHDAAVRRLIVVTSAAVDPNGFPATRLADRIIGRYLIGPVIHPLGRTMYKDMALMEAMIRESDLDWTIPRPPALFTTDTLGPTAVSLTPLPLRFTARSDLAAVMLDETTRTDHIQQILYVYSQHGRPSLAQTIWQDGIRNRKPARQGTSRTERRRTGLSHRVLQQPGNHGDRR